jgi:hypothetical protein
LLPFPLLFSKYHRWRNGRIGLKIPHALARSGQGLDTVPYPGIFLAPAPGPKYSIARRGISRHSR